MTDRDLNERIKARGEAFFASIRGEAPSLFNKGRWIGRVLDWCMRNEDFKVRLFRFVDVFPALHGDKTFTRHLAEYFGEGEASVPQALKWGARAGGRGGLLGALLLNRFIRFNIRQVARQFIVGEDAQSAIRKLTRLRKQGFAAVVDLLGEATVSEAEADQYLAGNLELLDKLAQAERSWPTLGDGRTSDWGHAPKINLSIKPTACYSQIRPQDFEGSIAGILKRLKPIYEKVIDLNGFLCLDMEEHQGKAITLEVFRRLRLAYPGYPHLGVVLQSYLKETDRDLEELLDWSRKEGLPISIRLVKGAYWDFEVIRARQNGWPSPVYEQKAQTDAAFERQARRILERHQLCHLACGSHNIRSIAAVMETAQELQVPKERYEFQVLYGMAEPVRIGLLKVAERVRLYAPCGELVPGMAYLVRRLLENTSNTSFLRQSFAEETDLSRLLTDPLEKLHLQAPAESPAADEQTENLPPFANQPAVDFARSENRTAFHRALQEVKGQLGRTWPLFIGGEDVTTGELHASVNPGAPQEIVGRVCQAGEEETVAALEAAREAFPAWRDTPPSKRAACLLRAAEGARERLFELAAWQVLEIGKQWDQAHADVAEAIDFLEYYARQMIRLGDPQSMGRVPGEENRYFYEGRGVAAVIAPWNFPLAISCGMASAALVAGNSVVYKPSGLTPVVGRQLCELFRAADLPPGVFNYLPGAGATVGKLLTEHPTVSLIAFTGSREVGLEIMKRAAEVHPDQAQVKRVVVEMGGKNAIIVDDDADLDQAVPLVVKSAFDFQGQKCSACSRVIVLEGVYRRFVERLVEATRSLRVGPAEQPGNALGPVAEEAARKKILGYIDIGKKEGTQLFIGEIPAGEGFYVPAAIFGDIRPEHRLAREEIFGPVLAVMRVENFDQALEWATATRYALTGAVLSRSPANLERAARQFRVGNLYLNRHCTAALVERQPFGGSGMSGGGTKAGGPDYLMHFMDPRTVTENTVRRGFAPDLSGACRAEQRDGKKGG